jgi:cohesin loading factor subunit SCC2
MYKALEIVRADRQPDEQATNDMLLKIFRRSIPAMPRVTSTFAVELVGKLQPMISRPTTLPVSHPMR